MRKNYYGLKKISEFISKNKFWISIEIFKNTQFFYTYWNFKKNGEIEFVYHRLIAVTFPALQFSVCLPRCTFMERNSGASWLLTSSYRSPCQLCIYLFFTDYKLPPLTRYKREKLRIQKKNNIKFWKKVHKKCPSF